MYCNLYDIAEGLTNRLADGFCHSDNVADLAVGIFHTHIYYDTVIRLTVKCCVYLHPALAEQLMDIIGEDYICRVHIGIFLYHCIEAISPVQCHDALVDIFIRRTEIIVRDLDGCDPSDGVMLQQADRSFCNARMEQGQVNSDVGVFVYYVHECVVVRYTR